jgi:putative ABC transport system permease protein
MNSLLTQKNGTEFNAASSSAPIANAIEIDIPEIEIASRITNTSIFGGKDMISLDDQSFYIEEGAVADSTIFDVLNFDIVLGNAKNPLAHGTSIVLNTEWSTKLFGEEDPIGQLVNVSTMVGSSEFEVTAVYNEHTYNSHLLPSFIVPSHNTDWNNNLFKNLATQWVGNNMVYTYLRLTPSADRQHVEAQIAKIFQKHGAEQMEATGLSKVMSLQPITSIHTTPGYQFEASDIVSVTFINVLTGIGLLILVLACVNYVNLSTAQAGNRALEVGVRKVMGISAKGLILQFLGESFIIIFISLITSILIAELALPIFNQLIDHPISFTLTNMTLIGQYMGVFLMAITLVAGIYPAVYLASFKPTAVLKGRNKDKGSVSVLRKVLVTFQFVISIVLISAILIISDQVSFIKNKDLGFQSNSRIVVPLSTNELQGKFKVIKQQFSTLAQVKQVTGAAVIPGEAMTNDLLIYKSGQTMDDAIHIYNNDVDKDYVNTLDIELLSGSQFGTYNAQDSIAKVLINRTAADQLGFGVEEAIGETLHFDWMGQSYNFKIIGVVANINQFSLHAKIEPLMLSLRGNGFSNMIVETEISEYAETIAALSGLWKEVVPESPFESFALNDHLIDQYKSDFKIFNLIKYFAFISVFISAMGLYALSMFVAERRFKEIGVRKALGAGIKDILILVSKDLSLLVIIAFVLSVPISIYGMNIWLDTFAYRITPGVGTYFIAGILSVMIAWVTIGYQSIRAAKTNPVDVLKDE